MLNVVGNIGSGVPARIGIVHPNQGNGKARCKHIADGKVAHSLEVARSHAIGRHVEASQDKHNNHQHLDNGQHILDIRTYLHTEGMKERDDRQHNHRKQLVRNHWPDIADVRTQRHTRQGNRRGKSNDKAGPPREETNGGMIYLRQVMVFAARARHGSTQFAIYDGTTQSHKTANQPYQGDGYGIGRGQQLKTERGKDTCANHIGNDEGRGGAGIHFNTFHARV